ncbi:MAG: alpha-ketoacid dehydrogenase subunit beta [Candidatus Binatia bacterium]
MANLNIVQAVNLTLKQEMEKDPRLVVMGEDVGQNGGVFRATKGLLQDFGENRVVDTPLSESAIVGAAIGMAAYGLIPVVEIQFMGFTYAAMEQLVSHAARIRTRTRGRYHCPMVVRTPYGAGIHAPEHHSESIEAFFVHTPGLKVVVPSTPYETKGLLISSIRDPDPVIFMEPARIYRAIKEEVPDEEYSIPLGQARVVVEGNDITLIAWGAMLQPTLQAAEIVQEEGIEPEVIDLRTLYPLDTEAIIASVKKTKRAVVIHEAPRSCGLGAEVIAQINEEALLHLEAPVERVTGFDTVIPLPKMEHHYLPDAKRVVDAIEKVMGF